MSCLLLAKDQYISSTWEIDICARVFVKDASFMDSWTCRYHHHRYILNIYIYRNYMSYIHKSQVILKLSLPLWSGKHVVSVTAKATKKIMSSEPTIVATRQVVSNVTGHRHSLAKCLQKVRTDDYSWKNRATFLTVLGSYLVFFF